jgi:hypothetical protein
MCIHTCVYIYICLKLESTYNHISVSVSRSKGTVEHTPHDRVLSHAGVLLYLWSQEGKGRWVIRVTGLHLVWFFLINSSNRKYIKKLYWRYLVGNATLKNKNIQQPTRLQPLRIMLDYSGFLFHTSTEENRTSAYRARSFYSSSI